MTAIRLAVIVSDYGVAANIGGNVSTEVRTFSLPDEIVEYIAKMRANKWCTVSVAINVTQEPAP
jgi:hypothetical protein